MKKIKKITVILLVSIIFIGSVWFTANANGNFYYVSPLGNDENIGTSDSPWKTIQKASDTATAGDTVIILKGTYNENVTFSKSGIENSPIIFQGAISPIIEESSSINMRCLNTLNACVLGHLNVLGNYIVVKNMEIAGSPNGTVGSSGISVSGNYNEMRDNFIHNSWKQGILINISTGNKLIKNHITYSVIAGIQFHGQNHIIENNIITHSVTRPPNGIKAYSVTDPDGIRFFGNGSLVKGNIIKDIYLDESPEEDDPHSDCFQSWESATNIIFDGNYCELEDTKTYTNPMVKFFMLSRSNSAEVSNIKIINNIFVTKSISTTWTPMQIGATSCSTSSIIKNIIIENNVFAHPNNVLARFGILLRCSDGAIIRNNAFYNHGNSFYSYIYQDMPTTNLNLIIGNNSVYNSTGIPPKGGAYLGDVSLWMINPMFISDTDYHLMPFSPLIDKGYPVDFANDYEGKFRPQGAGYDIGAYEFYSGEMTITPFIPTKTQTPTLFSTVIRTPTFVATQTQTATLTKTSVSISTLSPTPYLKINCNKHLVNCTPIPTKVK